MGFPSCFIRPFFLLLISFHLIMIFFCLDVHSLRFSFSTFSNSDNPRFDWSINSSVDNQALQITRNSGSSDVSHSSGQITYSLPMQLRHKSYNYLASFNTSFVTNMGLIPDGGTGISGGGMTFMLSATRAVLNVPNSFGQWLGLFDPYASQKHWVQIVAIELDTFKDSFDPDGNHVGIDVNGSIRSIYNVSLSPEVLLSNMSTKEGIHTSVWIDYNGYLRTLDVYLANQGSHLTIKPEKPAISGHPIDLSEYLADTVYVGFSASVGTILETHCVLEWHFNSTDFPKSAPVATILGSIVGGLVALTLLVLGVVTLLRWRTRRAESTREMESLNHGPRKFSKKELKQATRQFSDEWKLGQGGFGEVYRGVIRYADGREEEVAVKRLSKKSRQGEREFKAEVMSMGRIRHKNLVRLLGWRYGRGRSMMLVYEYMPNRSLDRWIKQGVAEVMGWERRYHVMKGVAEGLAYMHEGWENGQAIVHRDLKPSNVMLDAEFNARIGDFGLAELFDTRGDIAAAQTANNIAGGTLGYMAPEYMAQGIISKEIDIYSLGVLAIDLVTGNCGTVESFPSLLSCVLDHNSTTQQLQGVADPRLHGVYNPTQLELVLRVGLACCQLDPSARPNIHDIINALSTSNPINIACTPSMHFASSSAAVSSFDGDNLGSTSTFLTAILELSDGR